MKNIKIVLLVFCLLQSAWVFAENNIQKSVAVNSEKLSLDQVIAKVKTEFIKSFPGNLSGEYADLKEVSPDEVWAVIQANIDEDKLTKSSYDLIVQVLPIETTNLFLLLPKDSLIRADYEAGDTTDIEARIAKAEADTAAWQRFAESEEKNLRLLESVGIPSKNNEK